MEVAVDRHRAVSFFLNQLNGEEPVVMEQLKTRRTMLLLLASGAALAAHFGAWVASLGETTLTHSLLFVRPIHWSS